MTVQWGIAGPGEIANSFARGLGQIDDAQIVAVGSRSLERARDFAERYGAPASYGTYDELAADPYVEVVYVATPQSRHERDTVLFLEAGKHVLCEKPFALSAAQARRMVDAARSHGRFLMEAMWTRFLPSYQKLAELLAEGVIGEPRLVDAEFGWRQPIDPAHRLFDLAQGGGALLDLGVYPVQLCSMVLGTPTRVAAAGTVGETGVDEHVAAVLQHEHGGLGIVKAAIRTYLSCNGRVIGTDGRIEIPPIVHCPDHLVVVTPAGEQRIDTPWDGEGIRFQAVEVHRCLAEGLLESPTMPLAETIAIMATLDTIRQQVGVVFPDE